MDSSADDGPVGSRSSHPNYNTMTKAPTTAPPIIPARASHRSPPAGMVFVRSAVLWLSALLFVFTALVLMRRIVVRRVILKAPLLIPFPAINHTRYSHDTCSVRDSGCPPCPAGQGTSITLLLHLTSHASAVTRDLQKSAFRAQQVIWNSAPAPTSIRKTEALDDLHSSLSHWCCHTQQEHQQIVQLVTNMTWHPIPLVLNQVGCSIDHDNRTVSLQAIYDNESQARLRSLIEGIEKLVRDAGIPVTHPRPRSAFHSTLVRVVANEYPVAAVLSDIRITVAGGFATFNMTSFDFAGQIMYATET